MERQMAKRLGSGFGHEAATNGAKRLDVHQLIVDVLHEAIPDPCHGALSVKILPDPLMQIFTINQSMN